ncbi:MAG TPA: hypothetical protein V6C99_04225 [Oculatellaceae cyanobacterium]|jgi:hypothetical protein
MPNLKHEVQNREVPKAIAITASKDFLSEAALWGYAVSAMLLAWGLLQLHW